MFDLGIEIFAGLFEVTLVILQRFAGVSLIFLCLKVIWVLYGFVIDDGIEKKTIN